MPDNDIAARGNAMIYCDLFSGSDQVPVSSNITDDVQGLFAFSDNPPRSALYYCYAILNSEVYLERFEGVLFSSSVIPRIPILSSQEDRAKIVELGELAAKLEDGSASHPVTLVGQIDWALPAEEFQLAKFDVCPEEGVIFLYQGKRVVASLKGLSVASLALRVSGHNVIDKWMRERTYPYLRRAFRKSDMELLRMLISRIDAQIIILGRVDALLGPALDSEALV
jgi:hypothetical protein